MSTLSAAALVQTIAAAGASQVLRQILVSPYSRNINGFVADVTVEELHRDRVEVTEQPVQQGGVVTDHSFKRPAELVLRIGFSNSGPAANGYGGLIGGALGGVAGQALGGALGNLAGGIAGSLVGGLVGGGSGSYVQQKYQQFLALQASRVPFKIVTGKRSYDNMVITLLQTATDQKTENALLLTVECREVLFATTSIVAVGSPANMAAPQNNAPVVPNGSTTLQPAPNFNATATP